MVMTMNQEVMREMDRLWSVCPLFGKPNTIRKYPIGCKLYAEGDVAREAEQFALRLRAKWESQGESARNEGENEQGAMQDQGAIEEQEVLRDDAECDLLSRYNGSCIYELWEEAIDRLQVVRKGKRNYLTDGGSFLKKFGALAGEETLLQLASKLTNRKMIVIGTELCMEIRPEEQIEEAFSAFCEWTVRLECYCRWYMSREEHWQA
ncbi:MAG: hypothetical protein ACI4U2_06905 [Christensenellaceae bacterium]